VARAVGGAGGGGGGWGGWADAAVETCGRSRTLQGRTTMRKTLVAFANIAAAVLAVTSAHAQQTIKVGVILAYSGQFADPSAQMDNGIKLYMKQHGDTVAGKKIELIRKDTGGIAP